MKYFLSMKLKIVKAGVNMKLLLEAEIIVESPYYTHRHYRYVRIYMSTSSMLLFSIIT